MIGGQPFKIWRKNSERGHKYSWGRERAWHFLEVERLPMRMENNHGVVGNERVGFGERACRLLERTGRHTKDKRKYAGFGQCRHRQQGGEGMVKG